MKVLKYYLIVFLLFAFAGYTQELKLQGNDFFSEKQVRKFLTDLFFENYTSKVLNAENQKDWIEYMNYQYQTRGFFDAEVNFSILKNNQIVIQFTEGKQYKIDQYVVQLSDKKIESYPKQILELKKNAVFNFEELKRDLEKIEEFYESRGFLKVKANRSININSSNQKALVEIFVELGQAFVFDTLIIRNFRSADNVSEKKGITSEAYFRSILGLNRGDTISAKTLDFFSTRLRSTKNFISVKVSDSSVSQDRVAIILKTVERIPGGITFGVFVNTEDGFGVKSELEYLNLFSRFYQAKWGGRLAQNLQQIFLGLTNPLLFQQKITWDTRFSSTWRQNREQISPFILSFKTGISFVLQKFRLSNALEFVAKQRIQAQDNSVFNANFLVSLNFLDTDVLTNPSRGYNFGLVYGNGGSFINSSNNINIQLTRHNWLETKNSFYFSFFDGWINAIRVNGGYFFQPGQDNSRRFFLGGNNSIRSSEIQTICPLQEEGTGFCIDDIQSAYALVSLEFRIQIFYKFKKFWSFFREMQIVPFTDFSSIWEVNRFSQRVNASDLGAGLRVPIFVVFLRLDYAIQTTLSGLDFNRSRFILDVSQSF